MESRQRDERVFQTMIWKILAGLSRACLFGLVFLAVFNLGTSYGRYEENETPIEFLTSEQRHEWRSMTGTFPPEIQAEVDDYSRVVEPMQLAVIFVPLLWLFGWLDDPDGHFIGSLIKRWKESDGKV